MGSYVRKNANKNDSHSIRKVRKAWTNQREVAEAKGELPERVADKEGKARIVKGR